MHEVLPQIHGSLLIPRTPSFSGDYLLTSILVRDIFDEEQDKDIILILASIYAAAQVVADRPERGIEFGFFQCHDFVVVRSFSVLTSEGCQSLDFVIAGQAWGVNPLTVFSPLCGDYVLAR